MKDLLELLAKVAAGLLVVFLIVWGYRAFSNATVPVSVINPAPGIQCVKLVSADGVAVDCWKVEGEYHE